jgi:hypothetical protein
LLLQISDVTFPSLANASYATAKRALPRHCRLRADAVIPRASIEQSTGSMERPNKYSDTGRLSCSGRKSTCSLDRQRTWMRVSLARASKAGNRVQVVDTASRETWRILRFRLPVEADIASSVTTIWRDVTERITAETALRESEGRNRGR